MSAIGNLGNATMTTEKVSQDAIVGRVDKLLAKGRQDEAEIRAQARKVSQEFEAIFNGIMLKSMRDSVQKSGLIDGGNAEDIYRSMLDAEYAKLMAAQNESGLSKTIEDYLLRAMGLKPADAGARQAGLKAYGAAAEGRLPDAAGRATMK